MSIDSSPQTRATGFETLSPREKVSADCDLIIAANSRDNPRFTLAYFSDVFSQSDIDVDTQAVIGIKNHFARKDGSLPEAAKTNLEHARKRSEALEIIVADQIELSDWFGSNSLFFRTTEYDDYFNGVDAVVEFNLGSQTSPERIALSIDTTSRTDTDTIGQKIDRNISKIFSNKLEVKYFESPDLDATNRYKGTIKDVVPVVIGLEAQNVNQLITNFARLIKLNEQKKDPSLDSNIRARAAQEHSKLRRQLEQDPSQIVFLEEVCRQLDLYHKLITRENNPTINVKPSSLLKLSIIIEDILNQKEDIKRSPRMRLLNHDTVYNFIGYHCQKRNTSPSTDSKPETPPSQEQRISNPLQEDPDGKHYL